jgi:hypothetical protein
LSSVRASCPKAEPIGIAKQLKIIAYFNIKSPTLLVLLALL